MSNELRNAQDSEPTTSANITNEKTEADLYVYTSLKYEFMLKYW